MREKGSDYFENSCHAVAVQREYARRDPGEYGYYGLDCWGLSASDGPGFRTVRVGRRDRRFFEYAARGAPFGPDDGTIAPAATLGIGSVCARGCSRDGPSLLRPLPRNGPIRGASPSGFNRTIPTPDGRGWVSEGTYGLDQGIALLAIENYRSGLIWRLLRNLSSHSHGASARGGSRRGWL